MTALRGGGKARTHHAELTGADGRERNRWELVHAAASIIAEVADADARVGRQPGHRRE